MNAMGHDQQPLWRRAATHTLHTSIVLKARLEELLQASEGLLMADNEALLNLNEQPMRMTEIANRLILSRGGTTKVVDRLEEMGYVVRGPDPDDRRAIVVEITPAGVEAMVRARAVINEELESTWAQVVTDEEAALIVDVMSRLWKGPDST